jgi:hypothetical protein
MVSTPAYLGRRCMAYAIWKRCAVENIRGVGRWAVGHYAASGNEGADRSDWREQC